MVAREKIYECHSPSRSRKKTGSLDGELYYGRQKRKMSLPTLSKNDRRSVAKAITTVENDLPEAPKLLREIAAKTGNAYRIGITGPPGAGKSTLTSELTRVLRL